MQRITHTLRWLPGLVFLLIALTACPPSPPPCDAPTNSEDIRSALLATLPIQELAQEVDVTDFYTDSCYRGGVSETMLTLSMPDGFSPLGIRYTYLVQLNAYPDGKFSYASLDGEFTTETVRNELSRLRDKLEADPHVIAFAQAYPNPVGSLSSGEITRAYLSTTGEPREDYLIRVAYDLYNGKIAHYGVYNDFDWPFEELKFVHSTLAEKAFTGDLAGCTINRQPGVGYTIIYPYTDSWRVEIQLTCSNRQIIWSGEVNRDGTFKVFDTRTLTDN